MISSDMLAGYTWACVTDCAMLEGARRSIFVRREPEATTTVHVPFDIGHYGGSSHC